MELFNTVVGVLALIISLIALGHSVYYNLVKIKLSNCIMSRVSIGYCWLYEFDISNLSNVSVVITNIELFSKDGKPLRDNGFNPLEKYRNQERQHSTGPFGLRMPDPFMPLDPNWASSPFKDETEIYPASRETFSYYLDEKPTTIKITTDKRIYKLRKHQLFSPNFDKNR